MAAPPPGPGWPGARGRGGFTGRGVGLGLGRGAGDSFAPRGSALAPTGRAPPGVTVTGNLPGPGQQPPAGQPFVWPGVPPVPVQPPRLPPQHAGFGAPQNFGFVGAHGAAFAPGPGTGYAAPMQVMSVREQKQMQLNCDYFHAYWHGSVRQWKAQHQAGIRRLIYEKYVVPFVRTMPRIVDGRM